MNGQDVKKYLAGICLTALLSGATIALPGAALASSSCSGCGKTEDTGKAEGGGSCEGTSSCEGETKDESGGSCEGQSSCEGTSSCG